MEELMKAIFAIVAVIITSVIVPYLKNRTANSKYDKLLIYIEYAVRSAEQLYKINESKEKKQYVYNYILEKSNELGVGLREDDIDLLVEGVVNLVKYGNVE